MTMALFSDYQLGAGLQLVPHRPVQDFLPCGRAGSLGGGARPEADGHHRAVPGPCSGSTGSQVMLSQGHKLLSFKLVMTHPT